MYRISTNLCYHYRHQTAGSRFDIEYHNDSSNKHHIRVTLFTRTVRTVPITSIVRSVAELSMSPFFMTRPNPTHQLSDPIRPSPSQV